MLGAAGKAKLPGKRGVLKRGKGTLGVSSEDARERLGYRLDRVAGVGEGGALQSS